MNSIKCHRGKDLAIVISGLYEACFIQILKLQSRLQWVRTERDA